MNIPPFLSEFCRLFIFVILLSASVGKGLTFNQFKNNLTDSFRVPQKWSTILTYLIIAAEGLLAILIFINNELTYAAMIGAFVLFASFTVFISISVVQERLVRCNCFGQNEEYISYLDIIRNLILLLACGVFLYHGQLISLAMPIQLLLFGMSIIAFLVVTNLKNIATIARDPKNL